MDIDYGLLIILDIGAICRGEKFFAPTVFLFRHPGDSELSEGFCSNDFFGAFGTIVFVGTKLARAIFIYTFSACVTDVLLQPEQVLRPSIIFESEMNYTSLIDITDLPTLVS